MNHKIPPAWFCLDNYLNKTKAGSLEFWASALVKRSHILLDLSLIERIENLDEGWHRELVAKTKTAFEDVIQLQDRFIGTNITSLTTSGVRDPSIGQIARFWSELSHFPQAQVLYDRVSAANYNHYSDENLSYFDSHDTPITSLYDDGLGLDLPMNGNYIAEIDLTLDDKKLVDDFQAWLVTKRAEQNLPSRKKSYSIEDISDWHNKCILPYIDLSIWSRLHNQPFTQNELGLLLFPNEFSVNLPERIRKVVIPLAEKLTSPVVASAIYNQTQYPKENKSKQI